MDAAGGFESAGSAHHLSQQLHARLVGTLGYVVARRVSELLTHFHVPQREREHAFYPAMLSWLQHGIRGIAIKVEDVDSACSDVARKVQTHDAAGLAPDRPLLEVLQAFVRAAAMRRLELAEQQLKVHERPSAPGRRSPERLSPAAELMRGVRQPVPPDFWSMCHHYARCAEELRSLGRSPREMPEDYTQLPATYLPQLGPWPTDRDGL